jgi:ankyrin repeat protein
MPDLLDCCSPAHLALACEQGSTDMVESILRAGVDANGVAALSTRAIVTPLVASVKQGHVACAKLLVSHGANLNATCGHDLQTALHVSCAKGYVDCTAMLVHAALRTCAHRPRTG